MSWAIDLWDQYNSLSDYTMIGVRCLEKYGQFLEERSRIETDYASKLHSLSISYLEKMDQISGKDTEKEVQALSWYKSTTKVIRSNYQLANQHEIISEGLNKLASGMIKPFLVELTGEREQWLQKINLCKENFTSEMTSVRRERDSYNKTRNVEEKQSLKKNCEKNLGSAIKAQNHHYSHELPKLITGLQKWDEKRIQGIQDFIQMGSDMGHGVTRIVSKCLDDMETAKANINAVEDASKVIEIYKSGFLLPDEVSINTLRENMDTLTIENTGIYEKPLGRPRYASRLNRKLCHLSPYQLWREGHRKVCNYEKRISVVQESIDAITRMGLSPRIHKEQTKYLTKELTKYQRKVNKYNQIRAQLEQTFQHFSSKNDKMLPINGKNDFVSTPNSPNSLPEDLPRFETHMKEESLVNWMGNKSKCSALYPFEITMDGNINISNVNEFWIVDESSDMGWLTLRKMSIEVTNDQEIESIIPIEFLDKCMLFEHRFLLQESAPIPSPPDGSQNFKEEGSYDNNKLASRRHPPPAPPMI